MRVSSAAVAPFYKNGYLVSCERTGEAVLIDPGDEVDQLLDLIQREKLSVKYILLTHAHFDHVTGVGRARTALKVPIWLHPDDQFLYEHAVEQAQAFGVSVEAPPPLDHFYEPGAHFTLGRYVVDVLHTPGHCPGGVCLAIGPHDSDARELFVGDTLFAGSIGRTDLFGSDSETLLQSIREVLFKFPDDTPVHSGHGPATTIGRERAGNPFLI
jgi:glyoxylase-like metal-dependent hydrolase (beta-lactamase superfamily II)